MTVCKEPGRRQPPGCSTECAHVAQPIIKPRGAGIVQRPARDDAHRLRQLTQKSGRCHGGHFTVRLAAVRGGVQHLGQAPCTSPVLSMSGSACGSSAFCPGARMIATSSRTRPVQCSGTQAIALNNAISKSRAVGVIRLTPRAQDHSQYLPRAGSGTKKTWFDQTACAPF